MSPGAPWLRAALVCLVALVGSACSDPPPPPGVDAVCGDGFADPGEACDGDDLAGRACQQFGYVRGILLCSTGCEYDFSQCIGDPLVECGNGLLEVGEVCDGLDIGDVVCPDGERLPTCGADCDLDFTTCEAAQCSGECTPGTSEPCGDDGHRVCDAECRWGACQGEGCSGPPTRDCGTCGVQTRTCENGAWSAWAECIGQGPCTQGQIEDCDDNGLRQCSGQCQWGECIDQTCDGPAMEACGQCGTRSRRCDRGRWTAWSACSGEGPCSPGDELACDANGLQRCSGQCRWGACIEQTCDGPDQEACGRCGTRSRQCVRGQWSAWSACAGEGVCSPRSTQACGAGGQQTCDLLCRWGDCLGQSCLGADTRSCGACGEQRRRCDNGDWASWGVCAGEGDCEEGDETSQVCTSGHPACRGRQTRTCDRDCEWGSWSRCAVSGRYRTFPENAGCGPVIPQSDGQRLCLRAWQSGDELRVAIEKSDFSPFSDNEMMIQIFDEPSGRVVADLTFCESFEGEISINLRIDDDDLTFIDGIATVTGAVWSPCIGGQRINGGLINYIRCD